jgi:hypothetical protein
MPEVKGMVIHHTAGRGDVDGVISTFKQRNFPAHFVIDREGKVYQTLPDGARGQHMRPGQGRGAGLSNENMEGVEIIANDDGDITPAQKQAAIDLVNARAKQYGYDPKSSVFGHGEVNNHKQSTEGMTVVSALRGEEAPTTTAQPHPLLGRQFAQAGQVVDAGGSGRVGMPTGNAMTNNVKLLEWSEQKIKSAITDRNEALKIQGDPILKEAYDAFTAGKLTPELVQRARPYVSPAEYRGLQKMLSGDEVVDDKDAVVQLQSLKNEMPPEQFAQVATGLLDRGKISTKTYASYMDGNRTAMKSAAPENKYKQSYDYLKESLNPGLLSGPAEQFARQAQADALREFDNWSQNPANTALSRDEYQKAANDIKQRYQIIQTDQVELALGVPQFMKQRTRSEMQEAKNEDFLEAKQKLMASFEAGAISDAQFLQQSILLKNWQQIIDKKRRDKATAAPTGRVTK